ncbi:UNVERIFIED_CONTAM: hypothetical protein FKN15_036799 [Acipenser sinensis]
MADKVNIGVSHHHNPAVFWSGLQTSGSSLYWPPGTVLYYSGSFWTAPDDTAPKHRLRNLPQETSLKNKSQQKIFTSVLIENIQMFASLPPHFPSSSISATREKEKQGY